ncbi:MAG: hypothetical protein H7346_07650 [Burkholderiaceae bacterium]|nr:hypothetical protein [Burkholderiaceae bacterium]
MKRTPLRLSALALSLALSHSLSAYAADTHKPAKAGGSTAAEQAREDARIQALEKRLEQSLGLIDQLTRRLAELETRNPPQAKAAPAPATLLAAAVAQPEATERLAAVEEGMRSLSAAAGNARPADTGLPLHGFADVGYVYHDKKDEGRRNGSTLGTFDIYLTPQFGSNVRSLLELAFEYDSGGALGTDLERVQIGYAFSDDLVVWAGRFHTPYGYWNTAFHHGAQIQTSITRPKFLSFEDGGGIMPAHAVGAWATGRFATDLGRVSYDLYVANGNRISGGVLNFNASGDDNGKPLVGFNLGLSPKALPGLTLGLHGLRQTVSGENADATASGAARTQMLGGYGFYEDDNFEVLGEYYRFNNLDLASGGGKHHSTAGYFQLGYKLMDRLTAFGRYEKTSLNKADPYFNLQESGTSYSQTSLGLRYDLDPRAALKLELDNQHEPLNPVGNVRSLRAQYAVRF